MTSAQDTIAIPVAYIEAFVMMLGAFLIGYVGCYIYYTMILKKERIKAVTQETLLKKKIRDLQNEIEQNELNTYQKDRMDQDYEQVKFQQRAYSDKILRENIDKNTQINFDVIGRASMDQKDDLQKINGIGPYTEAKLNDLGIFTFDQISKLKEDDIAAVTELIKFFPDRIKNDQWVGKARNLIYKDSKNDDLGEDDNSKKNEMNEKTTY